MPRTDATALSRRTVLKAGLALPLVAARARAAEARMRVMWWGGQERARRTLGAIDLFHQRHPDVQLIGEASGTDYWQKIVTQISGHSGPDVYQLEPNSLADFARRGATLPLDSFVPGTIANADLQPGALDLCKVDGHLQGIPLGINSFALFVDTAAFNGAKIAPPSNETTWDQYAELCVALTKTVNRPNFWASPDGSRYHDMFKVWLIQRGKIIFTEAGQIGWNADDASEWFEYWDRLRKRGGSVPAEVSGLDSMAVDTYPLTLGKTAICIAWSNQLVAVQSQVKPRLSLVMYPGLGANAPSGHFYRPALIWVAYRNTTRANEAANFINFCINDADAGRILGVERGVPPSLAIRHLIEPTLTEPERATIDYVTMLANKVGAYPPAPPKGAHEFDQRILRGIADEVAFGRLSIAQAGKQLVSDTNDTM
jgi:multiple sugar transport system substrate-binding protein